MSGCANNRVDLAVAEFDSGGGLSALGAIRAHGELWEQPAWGGGCAAGYSHGFLY